MENVFQTWRDISPDGFILRLGKSQTTRSKIGTVIILHGRTEFIEKYNEVAIELNHRGFDVYTMDWRGQGLSDRYLANPEKGHIETFDEYLSDLKWFMDRVAKHSGRPIIMLAHSMGAHITARAILAGDIHPNSVILLAPMFGIEFSGPSLLVRCIVRFFIGLGFKNSYAFNMGDYSHQQRKSSYKKLSSDTTRLKRTQQQINKNSSLRLGGVTYGWIYAALKSLENLQALSKAASINIPVLVCTPTKDKVVSIKAQNNICHTLGWHQAFIEGSQHEVLLERDIIRQHFWKIFDCFIAST